MFNHITYAHIMLACMIALVCSPLLSCEDEEIIGSKAEAESIANANGSTSAFELPALDSPDGGVSDASNINTPSGGAPRNQPLQEIDGDSFAQMEIELSLIERLELSQPYIMAPPLLEIDLDDQ